MKLFTLMLLMLFAFVTHAGMDVSHSYNKYYSNPARLSEKDLSYLKQRDTVLVPGILSEVFSWEDQRVIIDFSFLTTDYFAAQVKHLKYVLKIPTQKLLSSSRHVSDTKHLVAEAVRKARDNNRKIILITHSLGGLATLDYLLEAHDDELAAIEGILFLQTPFYGSPMADIWVSSPYEADKWLKPFMPFFHVSEETVQYLSVKNRTRFMEDNMDRIKEVLKKIPALTMSGVANGHKSIFKPAIDVIKHGCLLNALGHCIAGRLWKGPFDLSDGLVPLNSSRFNFVDSVVIDGADHGEPIVRLPFQEMSKENMTESMIKLLLDRSKKSL